VTKSVLVTGGAGYIGSVVSRYLLHKGYKVRVMDSLIHGGQALLGLYHENNFDFVCGDVREDTDITNSLEGIDCVVHLAAIVGDPACARQPDIARAVNLDGSMRLFQMAQNMGVSRFVFASTCSNYGKMIDTSDYVNEDSELRPISLYAENKVSVENMLLDVSQSNSISTTVLRLATAFGVSPRMRFDLTVNEFTMEIMVNQALMIYGEQFWRPYVHVRDIARAIDLVLGLAIDRVGGKVFNVGDTAQNYRKGEVVDLICSIVNNAAEIEYVEKEEDPRDYRVSFERIKSDLGFSAT
ncbi:uncharacterized protein METZ01_LOCUS309962, partial [marine metagenome]